MKTYEQFITETVEVTKEIQILNENLITELTPEQEAQIDEAIDRFVTEYLSKGKSMEDLQKDIMNEGFIGSILGGLAGFALGCLLPLR